MIKFYLDKEALLAGAKFERPRPGDAGYDICASESTTIFKDEQALVNTGLTIEIPWKYVGLVRDRSSMALRRLYVHAGTIDSSYRGQIRVMLENRSENNFHIEPGQRIAQLLIVPVESLPLASVQLQDLTETIRGDGAFGSTGT